MLKSNAGKSQVSSHRSCGVTQAAVIANGSIEASRTFAGKGTRARLKHISTVFTISRASVEKYRCELRFQISGTGTRKTMRKENRKHYNYASQLEFFRFKYMRHEECISNNFSSGEGILVAVTGPHQSQALKNWHKSAGIRSSLLSQRFMTSISSP